MVTKKKDEIKLESVKLKILNYPLPSVVPITKQKIPEAINEIFEFLENQKGFKIEERSLFCFLEWDSTWGWVNWDFISKSSMEIWIVKKNGIDIQNLDKKTVF